MLLTVEHTRVPDGAAISNTPLTRLRTALGFSYGSIVELCNPGPKLSKGMTLFHARCLRAETNSYPVYNRTTDVVPYNDAIVCHKEVLDCSYNIIY